MARVHSVQVSPNEVNPTLKSFSDLGWSFISQSTVQAGSSGMMVANPFAPGTMVGGMRSNTSIMLFFSHENDKALTPEEKTNKIRLEAHANRNTQEQLAREERAMEEKRARQEIASQREQQRIHTLRNEEAKKIKEADENLTRMKLKSDLAEAGNIELRRNIFQEIHNMDFAAWYLGNFNLESGILEISDEDFSWCPNCKASAYSEELCDCWRDNENFIRFQMPLGKGIYGALRLVKLGEPKIALGGMVLLTPSATKNTSDNLIDQNKSRLLNISEHFNVGDEKIEYVGHVQKYVDEENSYEDWMYCFTLGDAVADRSGWFSRINLHLVPGEYVVFHLVTQAILLILNVDEMSRLGLSKSLTGSDRNVTWDVDANNTKITIDCNAFKTAVGSNIALSYETSDKGEAGYELGDRDFEYYSWLVQYDHVQRDNQDVKDSIEVLKNSFEEEDFPEIRAHLARSRGYLI